MDRYVIVVFLSWHPRAKITPKKTTTRKKGNMEGAEKVVTVLVWSLERRTSSLVLVVSVGNNTALGLAYKS